MNAAYLRASLRLWRRRLRFARERLRIATVSDDHGRIQKWSARCQECKRQIVRREQQLEAFRGPKVITAARLGLRFQYLWGGKGAVYRGAGHYTAGHRARNERELIAEVKADHAYHASQGWGGLSYEAMVADDGTIVLGNPMDRKSAAVASNNTGMVGICCPGTTGDRMAPKQKQSVEWLLANWHTRRIPKRHRLPRPAATLDLRGHNQFPGQSTACPGVMLTDYKECFR